MGGWGWGGVRKVKENDCCLHQLTLCQLELCKCMERTTAHLEMHTWAQRGPVDFITLISLMLALGIGMEFM